MSLLSIATLVAFLLRKSKLPYTLVLVLVGLGVGYLVERFSALHFLGGFQLSPELVFYVFLPTLIFESAFTTNFKHFRRSLSAVVSLATVGMLISTFLVGWGMHAFLDMPWSVGLLFGALISATDPISVLSLFKKIGAPKRLSTIIEGESLFNDGTALVLFGIFLEFALNSESAFGGQAALGSLGDFGFVVLGGVGVGAAMGFVFSKALDYVKNLPHIELSITLILAHSTFIVAEYFFGVSGILATVTAGIIIGNYGAYKISPGVKDTMHHFWDYSAFLANSILFLMVGLIIYSVKGQVLFLLSPILMVISLVLLARMAAVYTILPLVNRFSKQAKIPGSWIHLIQWSGLRGALAIALILTLPEDFAYYNELLIFTVGVIFFTVIVNGFSIPILVNAFGLKSFSNSEYFENEENQVLIDQKVREKLDHMLSKGFISKSIHKEISSEYQRHAKVCGEHIHALCANHEHLSENELKAILKRHLLGIEKQIFVKLYYYGEITQELLNILVNNVDQQLDQIHSEQKVVLGRLTLLDPKGKAVKFLEKLGVNGLKKRLKRKEVTLRYEMFRARLIATSEVMDALVTIQKSGAFINKKLLNEFKAKYKTWEKKAREKLTALEKKHPTVCRETQVFLAKKAAFHVEEKTLARLEASGMTSPKVYQELKTNLERRQAKLDL